MEQNDKSKRDCGILPDCGSLAFPYVPVQKADSKKYSAKDSLNYGTLYENLDMPFKNIRNSKTDFSCKVKEAVYTLDFAIKELQLFLDTHPDDTEAFDMLKTLIQMERDARSDYIRLYGPVTVKDTERCESYSWINDPWPWEKSERSGN